MTVSGFTTINADRHSVHRRDSQTQRARSAELVGTAGALQNQELMTQGKDFSLQT